MLSIELLQRLARGWDKRARVRSDIDLDIEFDRGKEDFLVELLPFGEHPFFSNITSDMRSKILSCGWIIYNAKTIAIETDIVHPVCMDILTEKFNGTKTALLKQLITETLVDESYHIHLCVYGNEITKQFRQLDFQLPVFEFVKKMQRLQSAYSEPWKKSIIQLLTAITSEIYITDYLALVSKTETHPIQPLNSLIVKTHRSDELVHGKIFTHIAQVIFNRLDQTQKAFFAEIMPKPMTWLADMEFDLWALVLEQIQFPYAIQQMIEECKELNKAQKNKLIHSNQGTQDLIELAQILGVLDLPMGKQAFYREDIFSG